ncbi:MAG: PstS family phosphate ABC transporter substrate-binding protein [Candidatus Omnitrophica bacterium]|nr:PstS family phosphate ABC transporter substrate-binding protein [Candidatus Omnitrophota bacterium]
MKKMLTLITLVLLSWASCLVQTFADTKVKVIKIDGSSTVFPITEAVAEEFQKKYPNIKVMVGISGTGGGFKKFCRGETDISDASRPIKPQEVDVCKENNIEYIELPVAYDGLAVVVNPKNNWVNYLTVKELKKIWEPSSQGVVTKWSQVRQGFPDKEIRLFGAGTDSGTFDYFTEAICGKSGSSRGDYTASEDDNVLVEGVANEPLALGYFGVAYYEVNKEKLKVVPIDDEDESNGKGPVAPTLETVRSGTYQPLSRPIFIYVSTKASQQDEIKKFVEFYLKEAKNLVVEVGYIPLQDEAYQAALERFQKGIVGSVFGGKGAQVGVRMDELLRRER